KTARSHPVKSAIIGAAAVFIVTFIGASLLDGELNLSRALFGLAAASVLGISFYVLGTRR
ncbi:MAG: hypothetical protein WHS90_13955, partial [Caldilinea sp.]|uniref:hypothetical protein n=1 Tax=Caldilinea sp. TaxID=2293560 RepID=UPI0030AF1CD4